VIDNNGEITVSGTFSIPAPTGDITSRGSNNGKVTVKTGGDLQSYGDAIAGDGETVVETGGKVAWEESNSTPVYSAGPSSASPKRFVLNDAASGVAGGKLTYGNTFYRIGGSVSANATWSSSPDYDLIDLDDESFTIEADGVFTVPDQKWFRVKNEPATGTPSARAIEGEAGATIVATGKFYIQDADTAVTLNFYDNGTKVTLTPVGSNPATSGSIPAGTYKWDANAGGTDKPGWKKQAAGG
jgi:hypothetical protein